MTTIEERLAALERTVRRITKYNCPPHENGDIWSENLLVYSEKDKPTVYVVLGNKIVREYHI